ncbi:MAG: LCP family protein [Clostridia bacterium]|nr:LCP family protein [Clostridia bacterium]
MNLIQFDAGTYTEVETQSTETKETIADTEAAGETEPAETEIKEEETEDMILIDEEASGLEFVETDPVLPQTPVEEKKDKKSDIINIMLLGTDERSKEGFSVEARSDSMILASINKETKEIKLVSLERGMGVPVLEGEYKGQYDWLTHMFRYGGANLVLKTVRTCFNVDVDRYIRVNFNTVIAGIDAIGGVDVEMSQAEVDYFNAAYYNYIKENNMPAFQVGMNHLDGTLSMYYARLREIDSDWTRVQRQRKLVLAGMEKIKSAGLKGLDTLANDVLPLVQTNLTKLELAELMLLAPGLLGAEVEQMTIPVKDTYGLMKGMGGRTLYAVDFETNAKVLHDYLYGSDS